MIATRFRFLPPVLLLAAAAWNSPASSQPPPAPLRDLVLSRWEPDRCFMRQGMTMENGAGKTPTGESLTRFTLVDSPVDQPVFTYATLPPTAQTLSAFVHATPVGSGKHIALFQDVHGWGGSGVTAWSYRDDSTYTTPALTHGWTWRVGFYKAKVAPPYRFCGFTFAGRSDKDRAGRHAVVEIGPVHVTYRPDDHQWLYTDLQPKVITSRDGVMPPFALRVANLGTIARQFHLTVRILNRNLIPSTAPALNLGTIRLEAGELREIPARLTLRLLGRYALEFRGEMVGSPAGPDATASFPDTVSVVNGLDTAAGFRHWAARRTWFSVPNRRPGSVTDASGKPKAIINITVAQNGVSPVPIFPVLARVPRTVIVPQAIAPAPLTVLSTQLSPAWLLHSTSPDMMLFGGSRSAGLGTPTHVAFATARGSRVLKVGESVDSAGLRAMSEPWLLVWWQGSDGWTTFDVPFFVFLQHRPTALSLTDQGVLVRFAGQTGYLAAMPLYGYAKFPQRDAWKADPAACRLPASWPQDDLKTWNWNEKLPASVAARCRYWASVMQRFPYHVRETYTINHRNGAVDVTDSFDYLNISTDWKLPARTLAPLSPTLAVAFAGGYPGGVEGKLTDCQYPTLYGPYTGIEGETTLRYSMKIGPYWMEAADPNLEQPADSGTPSRIAQSRLLNEAQESSGDNEDHTWDYKDGNFVWYAQSDANRTPAYLTAYTTGSIRQDRKAWLQARTLYTLLDTSRYGMDERSGTHTRRYIDGPGIGNWGSSDWGDSGKLGTDMILDAYAYAYNTGDYQTIADHWDTITSLNSMPVTMSWLGVGRAAIAEMGDEAPPMLGLARMAYAVGDRETYMAAVYWYARELVDLCIKGGAFTRWREQFLPWHSGLELPTETPTNLWGTNAAWVGGGFHTTLTGENQWTNFYVRFDEVDTLRFQRDHANELSRRIVAVAKPADYKKNYTMYFERTAILNGDLGAAGADFVDGDPKVNPPDNFICSVAAAWRDYPPHLSPLIPPAAPSITDTTGWAGDQMSGNGYSMMLQQQMPVGKPPTPQWFWWKPPVVEKGVDWGDKWTFGSLSLAANTRPKSIESQDLNATSTLYRFQF